jgi:pimeloyl-ACP methyl ester carboxylesterase
VKCLASVLLVCAALAFACGGDKAPPAPTAESGRLDLGRWEECHDEFRCTEFAVPLAYNDPGGNEIQIAAIVRPANAPEHRIGTLFVNPGGPGSSGIAFALDAEYIFPREVIDRFDIVSFDPRGVGESSPVRCGATTDVAYPADWSPDNDSEDDAIHDYAQLIGHECTRIEGWQLPHVGTINVARDMDRLRELLGVDTLSFYGSSYGTVLGSVYAELFPDRVRAFVLDGAIDPTRGLIDTQTAQAVAFEEALDRFLEDCASRRSCDFYSDGDPAAAYDALVGATEEDWIPAREYENGTSATAQDLVDATARALYDERDWLQLSFALVRASQDDDSSGVLDFFDDDDSFDGEDAEQSYAHEATLCADWGRLPKVEAYDAAEQEIQHVAPHFGPGQIYAYLHCLYWPPSQSRLPSDINAEGARPILVIGTTGDVATPYESSKALAERLDSGVLLTYERNMHTAAFNGLSTCVDEAVTLYLLDLVVPKEGTRCK